MQTTISSDVIRDLNKISFVGVSYKETSTGSASSSSASENSSALPSGTITSATSVEQSSTSTKAVGEFFTAYSPGNLTIGSNANIGDPADLGINNTAMQVGLNLIAKMPPVFDYPRKFLYKGSTPLTFEIPCFLLLRRSVQEDYIDPLNGLFNLYLPSRKAGASMTAQLENQEIFKNITSWISSTVNTALSYFNSDMQVDLSGNILTDTFGQFYALEVPVPFRLLSYKESRIDLMYGPKIRIEDVIIRGVRMAFPILTVDEGYPDHIALSITVETLRPATTDMMKTLFKSTTTANQYTGGYKP